MKAFQFLTASALAVALSGCVTSGQPTLGQGGTMVSGSAGGAGAHQAAVELERCDTPLGTVALVEDHTPSQTAVASTGNPMMDMLLSQRLASVGLGSPIPLIRLMVQQSGCFRVVDRGEAFTRMQEERALAAGGTLQATANVGGNQLLAADYFITPDIIFQDENAGRVGGGLGSLLPGIAGLVAGGLSSTKRQAEVMLTVTDTRTGIQEIGATGSAQTRDIGWGFGGGSFGGIPIAGIGGGYASTDIGKITAAALLDAYNKVVREVRTLRQQTALRAE